MDQKAAGKEGWLAGSPASEGNATTSSRYFCSLAVFAFVETHLSPSIPDGAVELEGFSTFWADRDFEAVNKSRGGEILFFVNDRWSSDVTVIL